MKTRIKKGDTVVVIAGKDRSKKGKVLEVQPQNGRVVVDGVNIVKRHQRKRSSKQPGEIIEKNASIHLSNVMIVCPKTDKPSRVGYKVDSSGAKTRIAKRSGEIID